MQSINSFILMNMCLIQSPILGLMKLLLNLLIHSFILYFCDTWNSFPDLHMSLRLIQIARILSRMDSVFETKLSPNIFHAICCEELLLIINWPLRPLLCKKIQSNTIQESYVCIGWILFHNPGLILSFFFYLFWSCAISKTLCSFTNRHRQTKYSTYIPLECNQEAHTKYAIHVNMAKKRQKDRTNSTAWT